ncbi:MAG: DUF1015 family protein [candidate division WOR-3 bacterium]
MAVIKPFKGIRPVKEKVAEVAAPPYDVVSVKEAREYVKDKKYSFLRIEKSEIECPDDWHVHDERIFLKGKENFEKFLKDKVLFQDKNDYLYIYKQIMGKHEQTGIVACTSVDDYISDVIKKHEHTREDKEIERAMHVDIIDANTGPVFLTYRKEKEIDDIVNNFIEKNEPEYDFRDELNVQHILFVVKDNKIIEKLVKLFANIENLYVADGHHRSAAAVRVAKKRRENFKKYTGKEEFNFFLSVIYPDDQLKIMDYNRVVKDLNGLTKEKFFEQLKKKFNIVELKRSQKPEKVHTFSMYIDKKWYKLEAKEDIISRTDPIKSLDVSILQDNVLNPLLGIKEPRTDKRINFVGGIRGIDELQKLVDSKEYEVAFALYPTSMEQLMTVADSGNVMPPKSTWFEPKLRSGLIVHKLS